MGYNYNYYYYHSSIPYYPKVGVGCPKSQSLDFTPQRGQANFKNGVLVHYLEVHG